MLPPNIELAEFLKLRNKNQIKTQTTYEKNKGGFFMSKSTSKAKTKKTSKGKVIGFIIYITLLIVLTLVFLAQIGMIGNQNNLENELKLSQYKLEYQEQLNKQQSQYYQNPTSQNTPTQNESNQYSPSNQQPAKLQPTEVINQVPQDINEQQAYDEPEYTDETVEQTNQKQNKKE